VRADHVVMEGHSAALSFRYFEGMARPRSQAELALAGVGDAAAGARFERAAESLYARSAARRFGVHFARPGGWPVDHLYVERYAAPGRLVVAASSGVQAAGGLGSLVLGVSEVELAASLAGAPYEFAMPEIRGVNVLGTLPPWLSAEDLVIALVRRLAGTDAAVLEFGGHGVAELPTEDRLAVARAARTLGGIACLFPSDERTRGWLLSQARESDWKAFASAPEAGDGPEIEVDLAHLEPMVQRSGPRNAIVTLNEAGQPPVGHVVLGPDLGLSDLLRFAGLLRDRRVADGTSVIVLPGSPQIAETARREGALDVLAAAGVRVLSPGSRLPAFDPRPAVVCCGIDPSEFARARGEVLRAGVTTCAATALAGRLSDPRTLEPGAIVEPPSLTFAIEETGVVKPVSVSVDPDLAAEAPDADAALPAAHRMPALPPLATTRGSVLLTLGDRSPAARVLPAGERVWRERASISRLAEHAFADADSGFAARARASGGGFVVAGAGFGTGAVLPHAALVLVELGVRVVLARSFADGCRPALVRHGVLPLVFASAEDADELQTGDELEITGLPEGLEPGRPLVVRDLTRAMQVIVHHDLDARAIEIVRAGGLQAMVRAGAPRPAPAGATLHVAA
jgi:aconitate hydratase